MNNGKEIKLLFVSGAYAGDIEKNIAKAEEVSIGLIRAGFHVVTPHKNTAGYEKYEDENITFETWIAMDLNILKRCDAIYLINGWDKSRGAVIEAGYAYKHNIQMFHESDYPPKKLTLEIFRDI